VRRRLAVVLAAVVLIAGVAGLSACAPAAPAAPSAPSAPEARAVTTEESQVLAAMRFKNFDAGTREFTTRVVQDGAELSLRGWVDYATHTGYAAVTGDGFASQALLWTESTVGIIPAEPDAAGLPPLPIPPLGDQNWISRGIDPQAGRLDATLSLIGNLGADRPENPLLVQQTGALWLREDEVDDVAVTVFAAPPSDEVAEPGTVDPETSHLRLWVDAEGVLWRAQVRVGTDWNDIDFAPEPGPRLEVPGDE